MNEGWPAQEMLVRRIEEFAAKEHLLTARGALKMDALAARFDLSPKFLHQMLRNKKRPRPHCNVMEFWEVASDPPSGIPRDIWDETSDLDRQLAIEILDLLKNVSDEEKPLYIKLIKQGILLGEARIRAEKSNKK